MTMNTKFQNTARAAVFFLCSAIALSTLHVTANAADEGLPTKKVSFKDLDISKPAGARVLYKRIAAAAHEVCEINQFKTLATVRGIERCTDRAIDKAVQDVGSPALSALRPGSALKVASN
jgi:UrcA family protein